MLIRVGHPNYAVLRLVQGVLTVSSSSGQDRRLQEGIQDAVVTLLGKTVHIIAFLKADYAWHYHGEKELAQSRLELGHVYEGGAKLLADARGRLHLFYFSKQSPGFSVLLRHLTFQQDWSGPLLVTTNVAADPAAFSAAGHSDHYLHLVYRGYRQGLLFYRAFDSEHQVWSGAMPLTSSPGLYPQLIPTKGHLYLFWQEEGEYMALNVQVKRDVWSLPARVSKDKSHAGQVGYAGNDAWRVFWQQEGHFYEALFDNWQEARPGNKDMYTCEQAVVKNPAGGALTLPVYMPKKRQESAQAGEIILTPGEDQLEKVLIEKAFRLLNEWEAFRGEIKEWQAGFTAYEPPQPPDLTPLIHKLARLERRLVVLKQAQAEEKQSRLQESENSAMRLKRLANRLQDLETILQKRERTLWQRLLKRG